MLRVIILFLGLMLLAAGFAAVVVDGTRSIASNALVLIWRWKGSNSTPMPPNSRAAKRAR